MKDNKDQHSTTQTWWSHHSFKHLHTLYIICPISTQILQWVFACLSNKKAASADRTVHRQWGTSRH